jgi:hypothetical protein
MIDLLPLAQDLDEYTVTPGVLGFIVFAVLGVGVWVLLKSMSRHLGKIDFQEEGAGAESEKPSASASASATSTTSSA